MADSGWMHLLWIVGAGLLGFGITAVFAGWLRLRRDWLVLVYLVVAGSFLYAYFSWSGIDLTTELRERWAVGVAGAAVVGVLMVRNVFSQPSSPRPSSGALIADVLWSGLVYGVLDGMFLSVMPVLASWQAFSAFGWLGSWVGAPGSALVGLLGSSFVTLTYHLGYPEYRNSDVVMPVIGNDIMSLAQILTRNPLSAILSHAAMHVAAVLHGKETMLQLPPHY